MLIDNRYKIIRELGKGGSGIVYLVKDTLMDNIPFALKTIRKDLIGSNSERGIEILKNEYEILSRLKHPNLIKVFDIGTYEGNCYIIMEYVKGQLLKSIIHHTVRPDPDRMILFTVQILRALSFIHSRNIIYRDLKPANIMISGRQVFLLDFGLSDLLKNLDERVKGTVRYMAPEIIKGRINFSIDIFSLGLVFFEMITSEYFYGNEKNKSTHEIISLLENEHDFEKFKESRLQIINLPGIRGIISRMTEFRPEHRYQYSFEIINDINKNHRSRYALETKKTRESYVLGSIFSNRKKDMSFLITSLYRIPKTNMTIITGPYGIGKTRLFLEFKKYCRVNNIEYYEANCTEGESIPYQAISEILKQVLLFSGKNLIKKYASPLKHIMPDFYPLKGHKRIKLTNHKQKKEIISNSILDFIRDFSVQSYKNKKFVFYFNDMQWMDMGTSNIVMQLLSLCPNNLYVYANINENKLLSQSPADNVLKTCSLSSISLKPFAIKDLREYMENLFGPGSLDKSLIDSTTLIQKMVGGNPLFLSEIIKVLIAKRTIVRHGRYWKIHANKLRMDIPSNIREIIIYRLDRIMSSQIIVNTLQIMALIRIDLSLNMLMSLTEHKYKKSLAATLHEMEKQEFICSEIIRNRIIYRIFSTYVKEIIVERIENKAGMHRHIADTLLGLSKKPFPAYFNEEIAYHFAQAGDTVNAFTYYKESALNAQENFFHEKAINLLEQALKFAQNTRDILSIELLKIDSETILGTSDHAIEILKKYLPIAKKEKIKDLFARMLQTLGTLHLNKGSYKKAKSCFLYSAKIFLHEKDDLSYGVSVKLLGNYYFYQSDLKKAISLFKDYEKICIKNNDMSGLAIACNNLGASYYHEIDYDTALYYYEKCMSISKDLDDRPGYIRTSGNIGNLYVKLAQYDKARHYLMLARNFAKKIGDKRNYGRASGNLGSLYFDKGNYKKALKYFEIDIKISKYLEDRLSLAIALMNIGAVYFFQGDYEKSMYYDTGSREIFIELGDKLRHAKSLGNIGNNYCALSNVKKALEYFHKERKLFMEHGYMTGIAENLANLAYAHFLSGNTLKALKYNNHCIIKAKELGLDRLESKAILLRSEMLLRANKYDYDHLLGLLNRALSISIKYKDDEYIFKCHVNLCRIKAARNIREASDLLKGMLNGNRGREQSGTVYYHLWKLTGEKQYKIKAKNNLNRVYRKYAKFELKQMIDDMAKKPGRTD